MAGIDKICEFSGDYEGWDMYPDKRDHIQVLRQYRHKFKKAKHTLFIAKGSLYYVSKRGWRTEVDQRYYDDLGFTEEEFMKRNGYNRKCVEYIYGLSVDDPELFGRVRGVYLNYSMSISTVKRRLKRMLKTKLNVVVLSKSEFDSSYKRIRKTNAINHPKCSEN